MHITCGRFTVSWILFHQTFLLAVTFWNKLESIWRAVSLTKQTSYSPWRIYLNLPIARCQTDTCCHTNKVTEEEKWFGTSLNMNVGKVGKVQPQTVETTRSYMADTSTRAQYVNFHMLIGQWYAILHSNNLHSNWEFSWCQLYRHGWHRRLSLWQSLVSAVTTKLASWQLSCMRFHETISNTVLILYFIYNT